MTQAIAAGPALPPRSKFKLLARDIKISHTIFALPWALLCAFLAANGWPRFTALLLIVICMVTARTVAMTANRLLDAGLDAANPRTATRAIPAGLLTHRFYVSVLGGCAATFIFSTALFWFVLKNPWPLAFSVPVLCFLSAYPLLKQFTQWCHYYLGAALALAPICVWVAVKGMPTHTPLLIAAAVLLWTAGFDIIYACLDYKSDLKTGVNSIPVKFGIDGALLISRISHFCSFLLMFAAGVFTPQLSSLYFLGVAAAGILLFVEQSMVSEHDLSNVGVAFFTMNGLISVLVASLGIVDVLSHQHFNSFIIDLFFS